MYSVFSGPVQYSVYNTTVVFAFLRNRHILYQSSRETAMCTTDVDRGPTNVLQLYPMCMEMYVKDCLEIHDMSVFSSLGHDDLVF